MIRMEFVCSVKGDERRQRNRIREKELQRGNEN